MYSLYRSSMPFINIRYSIFRLPHYNNKYILYSTFWMNFGVSMSNRSRFHANTHKRSSIYSYIANINKYVVEIRES